MAAIIGRPAYAIADVIAGETDQTLTVVEVITGENTVSGLALYLCSYIDTDDQVAQLFLTEGEIAVFRDAGGRPRGAPDAVVP